MSLPCRIVIPTLVALCASATACPAALAEGIHLDPFVWLQAGRIEIGAWDDDAGALHAPLWRVFGADLGEDPDFPFSIDEPGIRSQLAGLTISLDLDAGLQAWTGSAFAASAGAMTVSYGGTSIGTGSGGSIGFLVSDGFHAHPGYTLSGAGGADPVAGIYLFSFTVSSAGYGTSDRFWMAMNLGMDEATHDEAMEWVEANYVPSPGAAALAAIALAAGRRRRRAG